VTQAGQILLGRDGGIGDAGIARAGDAAAAALSGPGRIALAGSAGARLARIPGCGADSARIGRN
jgi:hypothetical protein